MDHFPEVHPFLHNLSFFQRWQYHPSREVITNIDPFCQWDLNMRALWMGCHWGDVKQSEMISFAIGKYRSDSSVENGSGQERGLTEPDDEGVIQLPWSDGGPVLLQRPCHQFSRTVIRSKTQVAWLAVNCQLPSLPVCNLGQGTVCTSYPVKWGE